MTKEEQVWDEFMGEGDFDSLSIHNKSLVKGILSSYAKQQAIAFGFHVLGADPNDPEMGSIEEMTKTYDSFIEQQNKP